MRIVDMHCDTISSLLKKERAGMPEALAQNSGHLDLERMKAQGYLLQNFALFVDCGHCADPWEEATALYALYRRELAANADRVLPVYRYEEIAEHESQGKVSSLLTVEEGAVCKGEIEKLQTLYDWGVRMLTLTWNYPNELGTPAKGQSSATAGLTETGRRFVRRMEELGMIVDVSHLSDRGFWDVAALATKPFVASHSNARSLCGHARNLTDEMIRVIGEKGGCIGLNFYGRFLAERDEGALLEALARHAVHMIKTGGEDVLGLGSDFDGIDTNPEIPGAQAMERVWDALSGAGLSQRQLDKIFAENVLRVYREIL